MFAAIAAAEKGHSVLLLEKNEKLGKKLFITGKGRCNLTNASDMETLFEHVATNRKFLYSAFYACDNERVMHFFETNGVKLKTERGNRVFPASDHSSDVIAGLKRALMKAGVEIRLSVRTEGLITENGRCRSLSFGREKGICRRSRACNGRLVLSEYGFYGRRLCVCARMRAYGHKATAFPGAFDGAGTIRP